MAATGRGIDISIGPGIAYCWSKDIVGDRKSPTEALKGFNLAPIRECVDSSATVLLASIAGGLNIS